MTKRIVTGGLAAGVAMFIWGFVSHVVIGLGDAAIKKIPNEEQVLTVLQANVKEPGFYFYPGMHSLPSASKEQKAAAEKLWNEKYLAGPRGILIYHPDGEQAMSPKQLLSQLAAEILGALVAAFILAQADGVRCYAGRVGLVTLLGLLPFLMVGFPHWNWYGFPTAFTLFESADNLIGLFIAGLVLAAIVKPAAPAVAA